EVLGDAVTYALGQQLGRARRGLESAIRTLASPESARRGIANLGRLAGSVRRQLLVTEPARSDLLRPRSLANRFEAFQVPLSQAKAAGEELGGSVNDVFVTGVAGAIGLYHERMGAPCDELRMAMPISTRSEDEESANAFTPSRVIVPVEPKDPVARFQVVRERLAGTRNEPAVTAAASLAGLLTMLPTSVLVGVTTSQGRTIDFAPSNLAGGPVDP